MWLITFLLLAISAALVYIFLTWNYDYWQKRGLIGPKPKLLVGNYPSVFTQKRHMIYDIVDIYRAYKKQADFVGVYSIKTPQLFVIKPELVHRVFVSDFKHFHDNDMSTWVDEKSDFLFANNPFNLTGEKWKERRMQLSPGMTQNRIKAVYPVTIRVCDSLSNYIQQQMKMAPKDGLDGKDLALRFTIGVVTDCVLGLNARSFSDKPTPILQMIQLLFSQPFMLILYFILINIFPKIKKIYKTRFIPKDVERFFVNLMQTAVDLRKTNPNLRTDYMQYMLKLQEKKQLNTKELTGHTMIFLLDGYETSASVLAHCLLLLARYPETQIKLRAEIENHMNDENHIDFDVLNELPYLDACVHESIRIFPPAPFFSKLCTEPIQLTNKDGSKLNLERNTVVTLASFAIMHDEEYYPNPEQFQPERFMPELGGVKKYRDLGLFLGFGDGPRMCLGMRFALAQIKAALCRILRDFDVHVNPKTRKDNWLDAKNFLISLDGGIWLDFESRK